MSNLQIVYHFKLDFQKWTNMQEASVNPRHQPPHNQLQTCNSHVEYPSRECNHDTKGSEGNMLNLIFKENVQGRKHPGSCTFAEPEQFCYRKPKV